LKNIVNLQDDIHVFLRNVCVYLQKCMLSKSQTTAILRHVKSSTKIRVYDSHFYKLYLNRSTVLSTVTVQKLEVTPYILNAHSVSI